MISSRPFAILRRSAQRAAEFIDIGSLDGDRAIGVERQDASSIDATADTYLDRLIAEAERAPNAYFAVNSRSFSLAARLFPSRARRSVTNIYAFCRTTDDVVDLAVQAGDLERAKNQIERWAELSRQAYDGRPTGITFLDSIMSESKDAGVPFELVSELIAGVSSDIGPVEVEDWDALQKYCYRVASVVGIWMSRLFGVQDEGLLHRAEMLGHAMQLTNILRDVGEDLAMDRVYLPRETLARHGLSRRDLEAMAAGAPITQAYRDMMEEMMATAERCYELSYAAMPHLPAFYARPVAAAAEIYRGILTEIRKADYDNLNRRAATSAATKHKLAMRGLVRLWRAERVDINAA